MAREYKVGSLLCMAQIHWIYCLPIHTEQRKHSSLSAAHIIVPATITLATCTACSSHTHSLHDYMNRVLSDTHRLPQTCLSYAAYAAYALTHMVVAPMVRANTALPPVPVMVCCIPSDKDQQL